MRNQRVKVFLFFEVPVHTPYEMWQQYVMKKVSTSRQEVAPECQRWPESFCIPGCWTVCSTGPTFDRRRTGVGLLMKLD